MYSVFTRGENCLPLSVSMWSNVPVLVANVIYCSSSDNEISQNFFKHCTALMSAITRGAHTKQFSKSFYKKTLFLSYFCCNQHNLLWKLCTCAHCAYKIFTVHPTSKTLNRALSPYSLKEQISLYVPCFVLQTEVPCQGRRLVIWLKQLYKKVGYLMIFKGVHVTLSDLSRQCWNSEENKWRTCLPDKLIVIISLF